jgi:hypothetical protein
LLDGLADCSASFAEGSPAWAAAGGGTGVAQAAGLVAPGATMAVDAAGVGGAAVKSGKRTVRRELPPAEFGGTGRFGRAEPTG